MNTTTEIEGRKILFENEMTRFVGMFASCNNCDRIIFEDEMTADQYTEAHGYCPECSSEIEPLPEPHDIETTPVMDTDDIFNLISNVLWGDLSEAIASTYATPREVFSHVTAMEEITQAITDQIPLGKHCKVWIDSENHALGKIEEEEDETVIGCPKCDYWESAPEDIPRRKLNVVSNVSDDGRYTDCQCPICQHKWKLDWNNTL